MANEIPAEWQEAAVTASRALQIAQRIIEKNALDDHPPAALLPAVVIAVAVSHAAARVADVIGDIQFQPADMDGIEHQLSDIASAIQNR
jgi:hypothetical protein